MRRHIAITIDEKVYEAEVEPRVLLSDFIRPEARLTLTLAPLLAPTRDHAGIREMQAGNACRCTGYQNIVTTVLLALERRAGTKAIPA